MTFAVLTLLLNSFINFGGLKQIGFKAETAQLKLYLVYKGV